jgi:hypothetical protein
MLTCVCCTATWAGACTTASALAGDHACPQSSMLWRQTGTHRETAAACVWYCGGAVVQQQAADASDARCWAGEADSLSQQVASLTAELTATKQQLAEAREQQAALQQMQSSNGRRMVELEGDAAGLGQQLQVCPLQWCPDECSCCRSECVYHLENATMLRLVRPCNILGYSLCLR